LNAYRLSSKTKLLPMPERNNSPTIPDVDRWRITIRLTGHNAAAVDIGRATTAAFGFETAAQYGKES